MLVINLIKKKYLIFIKNIIESVVNYHVIILMLMNMGDNTALHLDTN